MYVFLFSAGWDGADGILFPSAPRQPPRVPRKGAARLRPARQGRRADRQRRRETMAHPHSTRDGKTDRDHGAARTDID